VPVEITTPTGGRAVARCRPDDSIDVVVDAGPVLDQVVLRSYCIGAAHQALGWVGTEGIAVDAAGAVQDLTMRSFGILAARDMPPVSVTVQPDGDGPAVNGSDAVFAAVAAARWLADGLPPLWPTQRPTGGPG
jgi:CO/xanthine dehydrogenase Mo-binding subunit